MGVNAVAQYGKPPHPSFALIDGGWLRPNLGDQVGYVRIAGKGEYLGVLQVVDSGLNTLDNVFLDPRAWLKEVPDQLSKITLDVASKEDFIKWRREHTTPRRRLFVLSLAFTIAAGVIELSWNVGKYWDWWHPNDFWAGLSQIAKWAMVALGVGGITAFKDYRAIE